MAILTRLKTSGYFVLPPGLTFRNSKFCPQSASRVPCRSQNKRLLFFYTAFTEMDRLAGTSRIFNYNSGSSYQTFAVLFVFFLLGDSLAFKFYVPTFRNTLFHFRRSCEQDATFGNGIDSVCSLTSAHKIFTLGDHPKERIQ